MKKASVLLGVLAVAVAQSFAADMKPLKLDVPPSQLEGTPVPVKLAGQTPVEEPNPVPMVPADVKNIALKKAVTASDDFPLEGELEYITDGNKAANQGCYVDITGGLQWVQIDLGKESEIFAVAVWHFHSQKRAYNDVVIQVSNDKEFKNGVTTIYNNDHDNSAKLGKGTDKPWIETNEGKLIPLKAPVKAQYVRLYSDGNSTNEVNSYIEVEVFGR